MAAQASWWVEITQSGWLAARLWLACSGVCEIGSLSADLGTVGKVDLQLGYFGPVTAFGTPVHGLEAGPCAIWLRGKLIMVECSTKPRSKLPDYETTPWSHKVYRAVFTGSRDDRVVANPALKSIYGPHLPM